MYAKERPERIDSVEERIKIRAHHLLCMQGYQGYGYSSEFESHLQKVITQLKNNSDQYIQVMAEGDVICDGCPNLKGGRCQKSDRADNIIRNMDLSILNKLGLSEGECNTFVYFVKIVKNRLKRRLQLKGICDDCQWNDKCLWYLSLK